MNNILFISINKKLDHAISMCYQILNQKQNSCLLSIFNTISIRDLTYNYFISQTDSLKFTAINDDKDTIKQIYKEFFKYDWFIFLSNKNLYDKDFANEVSNKIKKQTTREFIIYPHNYEKHWTLGSYAIHKDEMLKHIDQSVDEMLFFKLNSNISNVLSFQSVAYITPDIQQNGDRIHFYSDDFCLFCKFMGSDNFGLKNSFVYVNRRNNKVYNIVNNIAGNLLDIDDENKNIQIRWEKDDLTSLNIAYVFDVSYQQYIPVITG